MPITKTEFHTAVEQGVEDLMHRIHGFLAADKNAAYSESELRERVGIRRDVATQAAFKEAVRSLEGLDAIRWGTVDDADYYIFNSELDPQPRRR